MRCAKGIGSPCGRGGRGGLPEDGALYQTVLDICTNHESSVSQRVENSMDYGEGVSSRLEVAAYRHTHEVL